MKQNHSAKKKAKVEVSTGNLICMETLYQSQDVIFENEEFLSDRSTTLCFGHLIPGCDGCWALSTILLPQWSLGAFHCVEMCKMHYWGKMKTG